MTDSTANRINLLDLSLSELEDLLECWGEPRFRGRQVYRRIYLNLATSPAEMLELPGPLRDRLEAEATIGNLQPVTTQIGDGGLTRKQLFKLPEGESIESVLMVYPDRATVCVSSQAGCPMGCVFCATGKLGFLRDLTGGQIAEQVLWAARTARDIASDPEREAPGTECMPRPDRLPKKVSNVVFMGMGEAFNNYDAWWSSVERLHDPDGFDMGARSFTVSTVGLVPGIQRLAGESLPVNLAVSLHAADDELRSKLMPVNKAYGVRALMEATRDYVRKTGRRVSFEYVLLQEQNDGMDHARQLVDELSNGPLSECRTLFHVNLIPWNPVPGTPLTRSSRNRVVAFQDVLKKASIPCTVRVERGTEIAAACGQLAGTG